MTTKTINYDVSGNPQQIIFEIAGNQKIILNYIDSIDAELETYLTVALDALDKATELTTDAHADLMISNLGRRKKLEPISAELIDTIAGSHVAINMFEARLDKREAEFYAAPELSPGNSAMAMQDYEIRSWWRIQPYTDRLTMINRFKDAVGNAKKMADLERIQVALMRSPIALVDDEARLARDAWNDLRRSVNPDIAGGLDAARECLDWARRGLKITAGLAVTLTRHTYNDVLQIVVNSKFEMKRTGYGIFGIPEATGAHALAEADRRRAMVASGAAKVG